jgi:hypothetical protein
MKPERELDFFHLWYSMEHLQRPAMATTLLSACLVAARSTLKRQWAFGFFSRVTCFGSDPARYHLPCI